jgi:hypothetical protein
VRALPVELVAPGHGPPFSGHVERIDAQLSLYARRQRRLLELLREHGPLTAAALGPLLFPRASRGQLLLVLGEVVGNLEVLEDQGLVQRRAVSGLWRFEASGSGGGTDRLG